METRTDFINKIQEIKKVNISYHSESGKYIIDGTWTEEMDADHYEPIFDDFSNSIYKVLPAMKFPKEFLKELYELLWLKIEWYQKNNIHKLEFYSAISAMVYETSAKIEQPKKDRYSIDFIRNLQAGDYDDIVYTLKWFENEANNYVNIEDFEKAKLIYGLQLHYEFLKEIYSFLYKLEMDFDTLNLDNIPLSMHRIKLSESLKCNLKFDKISTSVFFGILMEKGLLFMDENVSKNNVKIHNFIQNHFTYTNEKGDIKPITRINNELSKFKKPQYHIKELEVINQFIDILTEHRAHIHKVNKISFQNPS
jgi:hypothetical protein